MPLLLPLRSQGKTTLLRILGGKHIHERESVQIMGRSAFFDTVSLRVVTCVSRRESVLVCRPACCAWQHPVCVTVCVSGSVRV